MSDTTCGELLVRKKSWILATLVHRTCGDPRVVRPTPPNMTKCLVESDTTVGRLLRKKLFRGNSSDWKSPPDPWLEL
ncbi:MAG: hypothetical protein WKF75_11650 [Singulisphaera sp.]